jgi:hypothetical protein
MRRLQAAIMKDHAGTGREYFPGPIFREFFPVGDFRQSIKGGE